MLAQLESSLHIGSEVRIVRSVAVETQHLTREILRKNLLCGILQAASTLAVGAQAREPRPEFR